MYIIEVDKYKRYYHNDPDTLLQTYLHPKDSTFIITSNKQSVWEGYPLYETEMKGRNTALRWYRKSLVVGNTIYNLSAVLQEEVASKGYAAQFFASFHPGRRAKADTLKLTQKKLSLLLKDLQSKDTAVFNSASDYLPHVELDSADKAAVIAALLKPFPADTGSSDAKLQLLVLLQDLADDEVVHVAELLFKETNKKGRVLHFLNGISSDSAMHTFLRLAPQLEERNADDISIFYYSFREDSLFEKYLPEMIAVAEKYPVLLKEFTTFTSRDSIWLAPQFKTNGLERLLPQIIKQFENEVKKWEDRKVADDQDWMLSSPVLNTGHILSLSGMPVSTTPIFQQLLTDTTISIRALAAHALINRGIKVDDKSLNSILADNDNAYVFIEDINDDNRLPAIRHLLTQDLVGRSYVASYLSDDYTVTSLEQVTRIKVQDGKQPAEWLTLYRYVIDESEKAEYVLSGPYSTTSTILNFDPKLLYFIEDASIVTDKKKLNAEARKAYKEFLEEQKTNE
jgi:hypothetical protein